MTASQSESVSEAALAACKQVVTHVRRAPVQALLNDLRVSQHADGTPGRGGFGYYAAGMGGQFSGALALDALRAHLSATAGALPPITPDERALLLQIHRELASLNRECISDLAKSHPGIEEAVDPYGALPKGTFRPGELVGAVPCIFISDTARMRLVGAFRQSGLAEGIRSTPAAIAAAMKQSSLRKSVDELERLLRSTAIGKHSNELTAIAFQTAHDFPPRQALRYQAALVGVRSVLRIVNQLIYQAFQVDRLPAVDGDNLVDVKGPSTSVAEHSVEATIQPTAMISHPKPGEIIFFQHPHMPEVCKGLAEIVATRFQMTREAGSLTHLSLHLVDDELNSSPLFRSLSR